MTTAIILAGGMGTRLRSAVPDLPKPMAPIDGRPFLEYQLKYWIEQGIDRFVISVGYKKEVIMDHFGTSFNGTLLEYSIEDHPLGTGGGLLLAAKDIKKSFVVLNGDTFFPINFEELMNFHVNNGSDWTFSLFKANEADRYMGMDVTLDGQIARLQTGTRELGCLANGGVYIVEPSILTLNTYSPGQTFSLEDDLLPDLVAQGSKLFGLEFTDPFIDIGLPHDYFRAAEVISG